ncbi:MAG: hypothetical protein WC760_14680, partial [Bacteroidia bacterium]
LTAAEVATIVEQHGPGVGSGEHVFHALFRVGLLGYVQHDRVRREWRQRCLRAGEAALDPNGALPSATHYLVHPVLSDLIGRVNPAYLQRSDPLNIVGYDKPWRESSRVEYVANARHCCVLKADVLGFGQLMHRGADAPVRQALEEAVRRWAPPGAVAETGSGDSILIADDDPVALAQAARHLMDDVYQAPGQPRLRIALHYGEVRTRPTGSGTSIVGGDAVLCAARVEPVVEAGQIWATEEFREQLHLRPSLWRTALLPAPPGDDRFNVRKPGSQEPDLFVRLYRLEF